MILHFDFVLRALCLVLSLGAVVVAFPRVSPPPGSVIVRANTTIPWEFATLEDAANSLPNDNSTRSIFVYPGTYSGQANITRNGPLIVYGYTKDTSTYENNLVVLTANGTLISAGSDDLSGTLRAPKNDLSLYNINVKNTHGSGSQAIAFSNFGSRVGAYGCGFYGYQDTLYASQGTQVYLKSYIEGAVDFIFGRLGQAYFEGNTIAVSGYGCITASGRETNNSAIYIFNSNNIILGSDAEEGIAGKIFLGRPWADYARVIFKNTYITAPLNNTIWSIWDPGDARTDNVLFAEYNSTGPGIPGDAKRPDFSTMLTSSEAAEYDVAAAVGSDWETWVDRTYLMGGGGKSA